MCEKLNKRQSFLLRCWLLPALAIAVVAFGVWLLRPSAVFSKDVRNIVLISIDTCRADYLGCYGFGRETTPNIDTIANQSVLFENVLSPVPMTLPAHGSMLTGTIPPYHGVHDNLDYRLGDSNVTLAEILKDYGFVTGAIISAFVLDSQFGVNQGFDSFNDRFEELHMAGTISERRGREASRFALQWLDKHREERFFFFLHYYDPHTDYVPPEPFASKFADDLYAGEIAYTDFCIGQVIQKLKELRLFDSSLIIIAGDHGEMLGEHGEDDHGYFIYQSAIKVPLLFKLPQQHRSKVIKDLVGLIDIVPTVCGLLGIQVPAHVQGENLTRYFARGPAPQKDRYFYAESLYATKYNANTLLAVVTDRFKYIQTTRPELYDLIEDPHESKNLIEQQPHQARILQDRLKQMLEQTIRQGQTDSKAESDEQTRKRLESLGYISGTVAEDFGFDQSKEDPKDLIGFHLSNTKVHKLIAQRKNAEAKDLCRELLAQRPDSFEIYRILGKIASGEDDTENAKAYMLESLRLNPNQSDLHNNLSVILAGQDKDAEAIDHLTESLRIDPYQLVAHNNLGVLLEKQGKLDQAIKHFAESLKLKHNQPDIYVKIGNVFYRLGRFDQAIDHWSESLQLNAKEPHLIRNRLGSAFYRLGRFDDAIKHWSQSLKLKPDQPKVRNNIAAASAEKKKEQ
ncbi:MAG: sulfatase-like hydrolase/transferase [Planctomycetota bacterium]|jgi:arylsulfatase A-like enzyme/Tfp pilus assembly protein PilF